MKKAELRKETLIKLKTFADSPQKIAVEEQLYKKLFATSEWQTAQTIGVTTSFPFELNTQPIIEHAWQKNKNIAIPRVDGKGIMNFYQHTAKSELKSSAFGIKEPTKTAMLVLPNAIELLIIPGIVFHQNGQRIGYGGGFFDRYLHDFTGNTLSLPFDFQINNNWEMETFDLPVKKLITI